ncbi:MAG: AAA family ATPase [Coriobacteriales bacterium]|jgi:SpoVK/Ycf46/Vps4 family AAA+-type ATPase|nr:AAA family ATPase [Coriobacteriales bacterium]
MMRFYEIEVEFKIESEKADETEYDRREAFDLYYHKAESIFRNPGPADDLLKQSNGKLLLQYASTSVTGADSARISLALVELETGACAHARAYIEQLLQTYLAQLGVKDLKVSWAEASPQVLRSFINAEHYARKSQVLDALEEDFSLGDLQNFFSRRNSCLERTQMLDAGLSLKQLRKQGRELGANQELQDELGRIFAESDTADQKHPRPLGIPVHYLLSANDHEVRSGIGGLLASALYQNQRLENNWYFELEIGNADFPDKFNPGMFSRPSLNTAFQLSRGGLLLINYDLPESDFGGERSADKELMSELAEMMLKYRHQTTILLCLRAGAERTRRDFLARLEDMTMVELSEQVWFGKAAKSYLRNLARRKGFKSLAGLCTQIKDAERGYGLTELDNIFGKWAENELKTKVYPQYQELASAGQVTLRERAVGSAYAELQGLIGLADAKAVVDQALAYAKAEKTFRHQGFPGGTISRHMVFYGNPGTAKTTVARLYAQIMKDNGCMPVGDLIECGRADLVGKYVGWTAPTVREKFREAKGSVLFIDEAYSLLDERAGSFGGEAINTIVQEMENHRDDVTVIFAGYTEPMEDFLEQNPGLRSRIGFHVHFADYDIAELCQITRHMAEERGFTLAAGADEQISAIMSKAILTRDFGNGRFARNLLDQAALSAAARLVSLDPASIDKQTAQTLLASDFSLPATLGRHSHRVGF